MNGASPVMAAFLAASLGTMGATTVGCNDLLGIEHATLYDAGADGGDAVANGAGVTDATAPSDDGGANQDGADSSDGAVVDPLTCDNYCAVMMQNCTGTHMEYLSNDVCLTMCGYMTQGQFYPPEQEPDNVDSLGCRLWHAHSAAAHPEVHCRHAGPLGADLCGGPCQPFCSLDWHFCTDDHGVSVYDGQVTGCESVCLSMGDGGLPDMEGDSGDIVDPTGAMILAGNTLNCRLWHLETAIDKSLPMQHCPHTGQVSATCQ
jgi:hypothetical protein